MWATITDFSFSLITGYQNTVENIHILHMLQNLRDLLLVHEEVCVLESQVIHKLIPQL